MANTIQNIAKGHIAHWTDDWKGPSALGYYPPQNVQYRWVLRRGHWTFLQIVEWSRNRPRGVT